MKKRTFTKAFLKIMGDEKRQKITIPLFAILLALIAGSIMMLALGKDPIKAYYSLLQGCGILPKLKYAGGKSMLTDFLSFLDMWTPMLFASLAFAVAYKCGLFNIGVSGQMLMGGFIASITVGYSSLPAVVAKPAAIIICAVVGALVGILIGILRYSFNINEVVSSIMLNYIFEYFISFFILSFFVDPISRQSKQIGQNARLTLQNVELGSVKTVIPLGFIAALIAVAVIAHFLNRTKTGYEIKAVGTGFKAAVYAGMDAKKNMLIAMAVSGALAGIAGATYYMGYFSSIQPKVLPSTGFDSIAVGLLGNANPVGILFSSALISIISKGGTYMNSSIGVPTEITSLIIGLMLLFSACGTYVGHVIKRTKADIELEEKKGGQDNE